MNQYELRAMAKTLRDKYLAVARQQHLTLRDGCTLHVAHLPNVHVMQDGGAWIDVQIWVPKEAIE